MEIIFIAFGLIIIGSAGIILTAILKLSEVKPKKTTIQEKIKKGIEYEKYISNYYKEKGYTTIEHGIIMGKKDMGIDIIAENEEELILIQCKNHKKNNRWKIKQKDIKAFRMDCIDFITKYDKYKIAKTKALFITSEDILDTGAKKYIIEKKLEGKKIDNEIIPFNSLNNF